MTIHLDWFRCSPRPAWESAIHHALAELSKLKRPTRADVAVREADSGDSKFTITLKLALPGPDIETTAKGQTFVEALNKAAVTVKRTLTARSQKARTRSDAPKGVKPAHRG